MSVSIFVLVVLPALLVAAAVYDLTSYTIPNTIPGAMILLFVPCVVLMLFSGAPMSWSDAGLHLLAGAIGLLAGMALFAMGWVGGGDAKLFAAALLWLGWDGLFDYAIAASILGGALTLALILLRQIPLPVFMVKQPWLARLSDPKAGVPYGVALALAALLVLPETELFELASAS